jgi:CBS domain-containing protein
MTGNVIKIAPGATLQEAQSLMTGSKLTRLVVSDHDGKLVGMITQRDIVRFLGRDKSGRTLEEIRVKESMSAPVIKLRPINTVADAARIMKKHGMGSVVITDEDSEVLGIVTKTDICYHFSRSSSKLKVKDAMTRKVFTVRPTHSVFFVASLLARQGISRVPVANETLRGIITLSDMTTSAVDMRPEIYESPDTKEAYRTIPTAKIRAMTASDIMSPKPLTIRPEQPLTNAARLMIEHGISGIPVTDTKGKIRGIVTKTDIVSAAAK